jgi:predicted metal-dependent enzyme (double-stranded beta helix superfamily)
MGSSGVGRWASRTRASRGFAIARDATVAPVNEALAQLVAATEAALTDAGLADDRARCDAIRPAMEALLRDPSPIPDSAREPLEGQAVGNVLHTDAHGRFHVMAVVFPEATSSGVHHHGCWGVIGYLQGSDEETRYRRVAGDGDLADPDHADLEEASRHTWPQGSVTYLLPVESSEAAEEAGCWHRVRNPGPGTGVSVHVLCRTPSDHPHRFWDRNTRAVLPYPFVEATPGRWRAELSR